VQDHATGSERGLLAWASQEPPAQGEPASVASGGLAVAQQRPKWFRHMWRIAGGSLAVVAIVMLVLVLSGVFSRTETTPIGATVHVTHTDDFIHRSADITVNSIEVASDNSLCADGATNTLGYWVVVNVTVTNTSNERFPMNPGGFNVEDVNGDEAKKTYEADDCFDADSMMGIIVDGGESKDIRLAIDTNVSQGILTYDPVIQDRPVSWAFPSD
jgi:hypothetical protein